MSSPEEYAQNAQWRDADANIFSGDDGSFREGILTNSLQSVIDEASPSSVLEVQKKRGVLHLIALTICFAGVQFGWAVQIAFSTPIFSQMGMPSEWVGYVWLAGPISGLVVQPIVGHYSDRCTLRYGRRRPFILGGLVCIVLGMFLVGYSEYLGTLLGDSSDKHPVGLVLGVIGFWILDLSNNTVQGPCRALLVDYAPSSQQAIGSALFSVMLAVGNFSGYFIGSLNLVKYAFFSFFPSNIACLFTLGILVEVALVSVTLVTIRETPIDEPPEGNNPVTAIWEGIRTMPTGLQRVCLVQLFQWFAWFTFIIYITEWVGQNVFHGSATAPKNSPSRVAFEDGVRHGSRALMFQSIVVFFYSLVLPWLFKFIGFKISWAVGCLVLAVCLGTSSFITTDWAAELMITVTGLSWATTQTTPFSLLGMIVDLEDSGLYVGVMNIFIVLPQLVVAFGIGFVVKLLGNNIVVALQAGAIAAVLGALSTWLLIIPRKEKLQARASTTEELTHFLRGGGH